MVETKRIEIPDWLKEEVDVRFAREGGDDKKEFYQKIIESGLVNKTELTREKLEKRKEEQMEK